MTKKTLAMIGGGVVLTTLLCTAPRVAVAGEGEDQAVRRALDGFYESLNAMLQGDPKPAESVWSHSDDVTFLGADGKFNIGWQQTYANWKSLAALQLGGEVAPTHVEINAGQRLAVAHSRVAGAYRPDGKREAVELRATSVFRKEQGAWKMIGHHADISPLLLDREPGAAASAGDARNRHASTP